MEKNNWIVVMVAVAGWMALFLVVIQAQDSLSPLIPSLSLSILFRDLLQFPSDDDHVHSNLVSRKCTKILNIFNVWLRLLKAVQSTQISRHVWKIIKRIVVLYISSMRIFVLVIDYIYIYI